MKPRAPGQMLLSVAIDQQMLAEIDARRGLSNRSAFVRECLAKFLGVDLALAAAPDRTGKGGRRKKPEIVAGFPKTRHVAGFQETSNVGSFQDAPRISEFPVPPDPRIVDLPFFGPVAAGVHGGAWKGRR